MTTGWYIHRPLVVKATRSQVQYRGVLRVSFDSGGAEEYGYRFHMSLDVCHLVDMIWRLQWISFFTLHGFGYNLLERIVSITLFSQEGVPWNLLILRHWITRLRGTWDIKRCYRVVGVEVENLTPVMKTCGNSYFHKMGILNSFTSSQITGPRENW